MELLEREALAASLRERHADAARGHGSLVVVAGEAGVGKSALVRAFCDGVPPGTTVRTGWCDAFGAPRALGPLHDIARRAPAGESGALAGLLDAGADRHAIFTAFAEVLAARTSVTVVEDAHWADEATLDLLLFTGRRIGELPGLLVVTYRDDEVGRDHPLRRVLGDLAAVRAVHRLAVPALSREAVLALAADADHGVDADRLWEVTGGNAFFVTEALAAPGDEVPATVRDAVLARASRIAPAARGLLDLVAVLPDRAGLPLLRALGPGDAALDDAVAAGILVAGEGGVRFRHELARRAVEAELPVGRSAELHLRVLRYLAALPEGAADPARLSHHAEAAAEPRAVLRYAPLAARRAAALGAHREAAAHYARALRHASGAEAGERAELEERLAEESVMVGRVADAIEASARAYELWREIGDVDRAGIRSARHARLLWNAGRSAEAHELALDTVALLETRPPGPALAVAYTALAQLLMLAREVADAIAVGSRAIRYAERYGDADVLGRALNAVGSAYWLSDPDQAQALLLRSLEESRRADDDQAVAAAMCNLGSGAGEVRRYAVADRWLAAGVAWCTERDLDTLGYYARAWLARSHFEQGRWAQATVEVTRAAAVRPENVPTLIVVRTVLGRLRARRGDPDPGTPLTEAWELARRTGDLQRLWPVAAARAELAWLGGTPDRIAELVGPAYELAVRLGHPWAAGELGYWAWRSGGPVPALAAEPWALETAGEAAAAAAAWERLGCPYEAALARTAVDDVDQRLAGLRELQRLGARPAAALVARELREDGVRQLPRHPRRTTGDNPGLLTDRELEVLRLLPDGLRNVDIAARLHISPKTVDHHVSAILGKLGVGSRQEAAQWARREAPPVPPGDATDREG